MATDIDPGHVMPAAILDAVSFAGQRVLEVGAGDGRLTFQYAAAPRSVVGIDTKEQDIRAALRASGLAGTAEAQFLCGSATALPFRDGQFGIILLASSL